VSLPLLPLEIPAWSPYLAAAIVFAARLVGVQAGWARARAFADPGLVGIVRRPVREALCLVFLAAGSGAIVAQFAVRPPEPVGVPSGPVLLVFDGSTSDPAGLGFQQRYSLAQQLGATAARLLDGQPGTLVAAAPTIGDRTEFVPATSDFTGLVSRITVLLTVVAPAVETTSSSRGVSETVRQLLDRHPGAGRICVLTARRPEELVEELRAHSGKFRLVVAGVAGPAVPNGFFFVADGAGSPRGTTEAGARSALMDARQERAGGPSGPLRPFQVLALFAFAALILEWFLRSSAQGELRSLR
jgi:hypothetical protein